MIFVAWKDLKGPSGWSLSWLFGVSQENCIFSMIWPTNIWKKIPWNSEGWKMVVLKNLLEMLGWPLLVWEHWSEKMGESHGISRMSQLISRTNFWKKMRESFSCHLIFAWENFEEFGWLMAWGTNRPPIWQGYRPPCGTGLPCPIGLVRHHRCLQRRVRRCPGRICFSSCGSTNCWTIQDHKAAKMDGTKRLLTHPQIAHFQLPYPAPRSQGRQPRGGQCVVDLLEKAPRLGSISLPWPNRPYHPAKTTHFSLLGMNCSLPCYIHGISEHYIKS